MPCEVEIDHLEKVVVGRISAKLWSKLQVG